MNEDGVTVEFTHQTIDMASAAKMMEEDDAMADLLKCATLDRLLAAHVEVCADGPARPASQTVQTASVVGDHLAACPTCRVSYALWRHLGRMRFNDD